MTFYHILKTGQINRAFDGYPVKQNDKVVSVYDADTQQVYPIGEMSLLGKEELYIEKDRYDRDYWKTVLIGILEQYPEAVQIAVNYNARKNPKYFVVRKFYNKEDRTFKDVLFYVERPRNEKEVVTENAAIQRFGLKEVQRLKENK